MVSAGSDFGLILAAQDAARPSFSLFRDPNLLVARDFAGMLISAPADSWPETSRRLVAVFRNGRLRGRKLPFSA